MIRFIAIYVAVAIVVAFVGFLFWHLLALAWVRLVVAMLFTIVLGFATLVYLDMNPDGPSIPPISFR